MARFYASIQGNRGRATRQGSAASGITGHVRGWNIGARVAVVDADGKDVVRVYITSGSNGHRNERLIGTWVEGEAVQNYAADLVTWINNMATDSQLDQPMPALDGLTGRQLLQRSEKA